MYIAGTPDAHGAAAVLLHKLRIFALVGPLAFVSPGTGVLLGGPIQNPCRNSLQLSPTADLTLVLVL